MAARGAHQKYQIPAWYSLGIYNASECHIKDPGIIVGASIISRYEQYIINSSTIDVFLSKFYVIFAHTSSNGGLYRRIEFDSLPALPAQFPMLDHPTTAPTIG